MSSGGGARPLVPTFHGFVHNSMDGLVLFEACLSGKLHHVPRRPHDRERSSLIKSGSIFIYEENASGIKRWTDGVAWSPSRILGNFLIYRELEKPFPPGEKKRAMKRKRASLPGEPYPRRDSDDNEPSELPTPLSPPEPAVGGEVKPELAGSEQDKELERSLIGSLVDSYGFRPDGLVKKTMSISVNGISHHMVSYYKVDDVKNNVLPRPLSDHRLQHISVRPELYLKQNFRAPVEESEAYAIDGHMHAHPQMMYSGMPPGAYGVRPGQYFGGQAYSMYGMTTTTGNMYGGQPATAWPTQSSTNAGAYGAHQGYGQQPYASGYYKAETSQLGAQPVKTETAQTPTQSSSGYGNQYAASYSGVQRHGSQSTPNMVQSGYQTPVQPASSTFAPMAGGSARQSYGGNSMNGSSANGQTQQMYASTSSQQPYAVRSPASGYGMQSAPQSAVAQSPHASVKSPISAGHSATGGATDPNAQMSYRSGPYGVPPAPQATHSTSDINGLGISNHGSYSSQSGAGQGYSNYGSSQPYRAVTEVGGGQPGSQYTQ
nr:global transcription regulator sge1 [Quercus suber]